MAKHRSSRSPAGASTNRRINGRVTEEAAEITDIIPFNEFGDLAELDFYQSSAFDREAQVVELRSVDDLRLAIERAALVKLQVSKVAELVERNDVGDFSGFFGYATDDLPIRRYSSRRP